MPCRTLPGARPPRIRRCRQVAALLAVTACGAAAREGKATLAEGDRVQIAAASLGPGWHPGTVGKVGNCTTLLVSSPPPPAPPVRFTVVSLDSVTGIRREGRALSIAALRRAYGGCRPF